MKRRVANSLCRAVDLTSREIGLRLAFLRLGRRDREHLQRIRRVIAPEADAMIDEFEEHLSAFDATADLVSDVPPEARSALRDYLLTFGKGFDQPDYFERRLHIGLILERLGITPPYYVGAFQILFDSIARRVNSQWADDPASVNALLTSLNRVITLDSSLAVEMFHHTSHRRNEELVKQLELIQGQLRESARIDELTGILNRGAVLEALDLELHRSLRTGQDFAVALIDIDHFKAVNDENGHAFGDLVLREVARLMRSSLRPWDAFGRLGGDEFLAGLVSCSPTEVDGIAERIHAQVAALRVERGNTRVGVTISMGVAALDNRKIDVAALMEEADQALYRAKESGRNRTCQAERTDGHQIVMP